MNGTRIALLTAAAVAIAAAPFATTLWSAVAPARADDFELAMVIKETTNPYYNATLKGAIHANQIELRSNMAVGGNSIPWSFKGTVEGSNIAGTVHMGEYGDATWKATRA